MFGESLKAVLTSHIKTPKYNHLNGTLIVFNIIYHTLVQPQSLRCFDFFSVPVDEASEPIHMPQPELATPPHVPSVEETPTPTLTAPPPQQPAAENNKGTEQLLHSRYCSWL